MKPFWIILIVLAALFAVAFSAGNYMFALTLGRKAAGKVRAKGAGSFRSITTVDPEDAAWFEEHREARTLTAADGCCLAASAVRKPERTHRWVIALHGYRGSSRDMARAARRFFEMGFNVLTPDLRAHGQSGGRYIGMGVKDRREILLWLADLRSRDPEAGAVLYGISMGAATAVMTAGENPAGAVGLIEDCGYTSVTEEFSYQMRAVFGLPPFPFLPLASLACRLRAGYFFGEASPRRSMEQLRLPVLILHGTADVFVPVRMGKELYEAAKGPRRLELFEGARHVESEAREPERYWQAIREFTAAL